jgi:hypothetical protein
MVNLKKVSVEFCYQKEGNNEKDWSGSFIWNYVVYSCRCVKRSTQKCPKTIQMPVLHGITPCTLVTKIRFDKGLNQSSGLILREQYIVYISTGKERGGRDEISLTIYDMLLFVNCGHLCP